MNFTRIALERRTLTHFITALIFLGGIAAVAIAYWGGKGVRAIFLPQVAWPSSPVDQRLLLFTLAAAVTTGP